MSEITWRKVDDYHIRSRCGRFTVARLNVVDRCWYVAYRLPFSEAEPSTELGATILPADADDAERSAAIHAMKLICEAAA